MAKILSPRYLITGLILIALVIVLPQILTSYWLRALTTSLIFSLAAAGIALLYGKLGLVSLCQFALAGLGAWVAMRLGIGTGVPFELLILAAGIVVGIIGFLIGLPALRVRGLYLALITLMLAGGFQVIATVSGFPDGGGGFFGRLSSGSRIVLERPFIAQTDVAYFRYCAGVVALGFILVELLKHSRAGRAWAAIHRSEASALSVGINVTLYKVWAFALAGFLAGVSGALVAGAVGQLDGRNFPAGDSILLFALTVVGGAYGWPGQLITGILFRAVPALLDYVKLNGNLATIFFGLSLLNALITAPTGLAGQFGGLLKKIRNG
jgi:branched-chain amino acid transport system permease protein